MSLLLAIQKCSGSCHWVRAGGAAPDALTQRINALQNDDAAFWHLLVSEADALAFLE